MTAANELPKFQSHKTVSAFEILHCVHNGDYYLLYGENNIKYRVPTNWAVRVTTSADRGYFVKYPDGFESWSPKEEFETGYTPVLPSPPTSNAEMQVMIANEAQQLKQTDNELIGKPPAGVFLDDIPKCHELYKHVRWLYKEIHDMERAIKLKYDDRHESFEERLDRLCWPVKLEETKKELKRVQDELKNFGVHC